MILDNVSTISPVLPLSDLTFQEAILKSLIKHPYVVNLTYLIPWLTPLLSSYHVTVSLSIGFPLNSMGYAPFHRAAFDYSSADWDGHCDNLRDLL